MKSPLSSSKRFYPHMNQALGKYYYTKADYLADLKAKHLEPYTPHAVGRPPHQDYRPSTWARAMIETRRQGRPGQVFYDELKRRGVEPFRRPALPQIPASSDPTQGGFW